MRHIHPKLTLAGTALMCMALGSVHAFSVLLEPMEQAFSISRKSSSLTYSLALVWLAAAVLLGHRLYARISPFWFAMIVGILASLGCAMAALSSSEIGVWLSYSLLFGAANGLGYGYSLQLAARAFPRSSGFAMGFITAAYALGAASFPPFLMMAVNIDGWQAAMLLLAICNAVFCSFSAALLRRSNIIYDSSSNDAPSKSKADFRANSRVNLRRSVFKLWLIYCGAVTAGLMTIGHAAAIVEAIGAKQAWIVAAPIIIAIANMFGSLSGGIAIDKFNGRLTLSVLIALSVIALMTLAATSELIIILAGMALTGFTYGGIIAAYPAYISKRFGMTAGAAIYGQVFTAWAVAGLVGPLSAGFLYDQSQSYDLALLLAAGLAFCSLLLMLLQVRR